MFALQTGVRCSHAFVVSTLPSGGSRFTVRSHRMPSQSSLKNSLLDDQQEAVLWLSSVPGNESVVSFANPGTPDAINKILQSVLASRTTTRSERGVDLTSAEYRYPYEKFEAFEGNEPVLAAASSEFVIRDVVSRSEVYGRSQLSSRPAHVFGVSTSTNCSSSEQDRCAVVRYASGARYAFADTIARSPDLQPSVDDASSAFEWFDELAARYTGGGSGSAGSGGLGVWSRVTVAADVEGEEEKEGVVLSVVDQAGGASVMGVVCSDSYRRVLRSRVRARVQTREDSPSRSFGDGGGNDGADNDAGDAEDGNAGGGGNDGAVNDGADNDAGNAGDAELVGGGLFRGVGPRQLAYWEKPGEGADDNTNELARELLNSDVESSVDFVRGSAVDAVYPSFETFSELIGDDVEDFAQWLRTIPTFVTSTTTGAPLPARMDAAVGHDRLLATITIRASSCVARFTVTSTIKRGARTATSPSGCPLTTWR